MGKADTHRDAHLRLFIPHGTYNTSITGDILERLVQEGDVRPGCRKRKDEAEGRGRGRISSPGTAAKRARSKILGTVVVLPLNFLSFLPPSVSLSLSFFPNTPFSISPFVLSSPFRYNSTDNQAANDSFSRVVYVSLPCHTNENGNGKVLPIRKLPWISL